VLNSLARHFDHPQLWGRHVASHSVVAAIRVQPQCTKVRLSAQYGYALYPVAAFEHLAHAQLLEIPFGELSVLHEQEEVLQRRDAPADPVEQVLADVEAGTLGPAHVGEPQSADKRAGEDEQLAEDALAPQPVQPVQVQGVNEGEPVVRVLRGCGRAKIRKWSAFEACVAGTLWRAL
jgi:hypothetical protein